MHLSGIYPAPSSTQAPAYVRHRVSNTSRAHVRHHELPSWKFLIFNFFFIKYRPHHISLKCLFVVPFGVDGLTNKLLKVLLIISVDFAVIILIFVDFCDDPTPSYGHTDPPSPNGRYLVGSSVNFSCILGFRMKGNTFSICQSNFPWSREPASCAFGNEMQYLFLIWIFLKQK